MRSGHVGVHGTLMGFLAAGLGYQNCYWKADKGPREKLKIIRSGGWRKACRCATCKLTVVVEDS
jgi:hypothetical protein